jgi:AbrB family looped-hinge helix DNA binding protein
MTSIFRKLGAKSQITIPKEVRRALGAKPGDTLVYRITEGTVTLARAEALGRAYLEALECTLSEWGSPEDAAAYDKLR